MGYYLQRMRTGLAFGFVILYVLHQDWWFWRAVQPLVLGYLPVGLAYHALYTIAVAGFFWLLVHFAWPHHLDEESER